MRLASALALLSAALPVSALGCGTTPGAVMRLVNTLLAALPAATALAPIERRTLFKGVAAAFRAIDRDPFFWGGTIQNI